MIVASLVLATAVAQDPASLLAKSRGAYEHLASARLSEKFSVEDATGKKLSGTVVVAMKKPGSLSASIEYAKGATTVVVADTKHIWSKKGTAKTKVQPFSFAALGRALPVNIEALCLLDWAHELSTDRDGGMEGGTLRVEGDKTWKGRVCIVLSETNRSEDVKDEYYFDATTYLVWRVVDASLQSGKVYSETEVFSLESDPVLPESLFKVP